jgi:hypothetical protein
MPGNNAATTLNLFCTRAAGSSAVHLLGSKQPQTCEMLTQPTHFPSGRL